MPADFAWPLDILLRVTKFVKAEVAQQPLLTIYHDPPEWKAPTAMALGSGQTFEAHTGASGLGYTVFTKGLVCFGKPRDGRACFLAAPDYRVIGSEDNFIAIKRGIIEIINDEPQLKFRDIGGGNGLLALTFAGQAFHAVYLEGGDLQTSRIATSFDGVNWKDQEAVFPYNGIGNVGGAVAFDGHPDFLYSGTYTMAGNTQVEIPDTEPIWIEGIENLAWATAVPPSPPEEGEPIRKAPEWSYGFNSEPRGQPGAIMARSGVQNQQATIAGGNGIFAAATFEKDIQVIDMNPGFEPPIEQTRILYTAAVASSLKGSAWVNHELDGVQKGLLVPGTDSEYGESRTMATVFMRDQIPKNSFFICAVHNSYFGSHKTSNWTTVHKSFDCNDWTLVRSVGAKGDGGKNFCATLSVIDSNLGNTTIFYL